MSERPSQAKRPPDPAGTLPKVDPESLRPSRQDGVLALIPAHITTAEDPSRTLRERDPDRTPERSAATEQSLTKRAPQVETPYAPRFQFLLGALTAIGVAAIGLAVVIVLAPSPTPAPPWSAWKPLNNGADPAQQIAEHVGPKYKLPSGKQLLQVTGGPQSINGQPVVLALRTSGSEPSALPSNGVFYQLCGGGPDCSIAEGKASVERGLLVRREALELALYTFHYISGASQVLVTFPPAPPSKNSSGKSTSATQSGSATIFPTLTASGTSTKSANSTSSSSQAPTRVLLFRPSEVEAELSKPLEDSLSSVAPSISTMDASPDAALVNRLTENVIYDSVLIQEEQSGPVLLLQPPSLGG